MQAKTISKTRRVQVKQKKEISFPLDKANFIIIGAGILMLVIGYVFMSENSVDGFLPTVVAPILLVLGYCVVIPYGILKKSKTGEPNLTDNTASTLAQNPTQKASSNVKTK